MPEYVKYPYEPRGAAWELFRTREDLVIEGPAGTGKTRAVLQYIHWLCTMFPSIRVLFARKIRADMSEAALEIFEERVLPPLHPALGNSPRRNQRQAYKYANGSEIVVRGLDRASRTFSSQYDVVVIFEAVETTFEDFELLHRCLRNGALPWQQMVLECNPDSQYHWINRIANEKRLVRLLSRHEDNPACTEAYLERLKRLTGVRRARLYEGRWVSAEGQVWENYDAAVHRLGQLPRGSDGRINITHYIAGVDWGFRAPGVIQVWGIDPDGRMYLVHETYRVEKTIDWWIEEAKRLHKMLRPKHWVCDPAQPDYIGDFRKAGLPAQGAENAILPGLDEVSDRLALQADGQPGAYLMRYARDTMDPLLYERGRPTSLEEEIPGYVFPKGIDGKIIKELPDPACPDHGCDVFRYVAMFLKRYAQPSEKKLMTYPAGSLGALLKHSDVLEASKDPPWRHSTSR